MNSRVNLTQKIVTLDSSKRLYGSTSSFSVKGNIPQVNAFNRASVIMCQVPKSYYSSDVALTGQINGAGVVTLPTGKFWSASSLAVDLAAAMGAPYTVVYDSVTGKMTIGNGGSGAFTFRADDALLAKYLGLVAGVVYASDGSDEIVSVNIVDMQRYGSLFVTCSIIKNNNDNRLVSLFPGGTPNLAFMGYSSPAMDLGSVNVVNSSTDVINVQVVDEDGKEVELNGVNCRVMLTLYNEAD